MGVMLTQIQQTSVVADALYQETANTYTTGINSPGGPVEFLMLRVNGVSTADPCLADLSNLVDTLRVICNGEVLFDFRAGYTDDENNNPGVFGAFLNSIGGRAYEVPSGTTTREAYYAIPIGRQFPAAVNRWEIILGWAATGTNGGADTGSLQFWLRTNTGMTQQTTVVSPTSFTHAVGIEMVTVKIPANVPGTVAGILVCNDTAADELGTQGIRVNALSQFGVPAQMWRFWNGDMANGIMYADSDIVTIRQEYAFQAPGQIFIPTFNLQGGLDIVLQVDSSTITTRTYMPVMVAPVNASSGPEQTQGARVKGSPTQAIVSRSEN